MRIQSISRMYQATSTDEHFKNPHNSFYIDFSDDDGAHHSISVKEIDFESQIIRDQNDVVYSVPSAKMEEIAEELRVDFSADAEVTYGSLSSFEGYRLTQSPTGFTLTPMDGGPSYNINGFYVTETFSEEKPLTQIYEEAQRDRQLCIEDIERLRADSSMDPAERDSAIRSLQLSLQQLDRFEEYYEKIPEADRASTIEKTSIGLEVIMTGTDADNNPVHIKVEHLGYDLFNALGQPVPQDVSDIEMGKALTSLAHELQTELHHEDFIERFDSYTPGEWDASNLKIVKDKNSANVDVVFQEGKNTFKVPIEDCTFVQSQDGLRLNIMTNSGDVVQYSVVSLDNKFASEHGIRTTSQMLNYADFVNNTNELKMESHHSAEGYAAVTHKEKLPIEVTAAWNADGRVEKTYVVAGKAYSAEDLESQAFYSKENNFLMIGNKMYTIGDGQLGTSTGTCIVNDTEGSVTLPASTSPTGKEMTVQADIVDYSRQVVKIDGMIYKFDEFPTDITGRQLDKTASPYMNPDKNEIMEHIDLMSTPKKSMQATLNGWELISENNKLMMTGTIDGVEVKKPVESIEMSGNTPIIHFDKDNWATLGFPSAAEMTASNVFAHAKGELDTSGVPMNSTADVINNIGIKSLISQIDATVDISPVQSVRTLPDKCFVIVDNEEYSQQLFCKVGDRLFNADNTETGLGFKDLQHDVTGAFTTNNQHTLELFTQVLEGQHFTAKAAGNDFILTNDDGEVSRANVLVSFETEAFAHESNQVMDIERNSVPEVAPEID